MPEAIEEQRPPLSTRMNAQEMAKMKREADATNKGLKAKGKNYGGEMGKDHFLKLLVTELRHQDPTAPMADKEFIAQMAQFSSLEQMQNINTSMTALNNKAKVSEAYDLIGKRVVAVNEETGKQTEGVVSHVLRNGGDVRLVVSGEQVALDEIQAVFAVEPKAQREQRTTQSDDTVNRGQAARTYDAAGAPAKQQSVNISK